MNNLKQMEELKDLDQAVEGANWVKDLISNHKNKIIAAGAFFALLIGK